jgi:two-component system KDP operon response regulator KdpE
MTKTILIFDRQAIARRLLRFALELQGFRVIEMGDLFGALEALANGKPDLLVIGVDLADTGRHDLADSVRRRSDLDGLPILFVGEGQCKERMNLARIGSCAWLDKPFRMLELHGLVEGLLGCAPLPDVQFSQSQVNVRHHESRNA